MQCNLAYEWMLCLLDVTSAKLGLSRSRSTSDLEKANRVCFVNKIRNNKKRNGSIDVYTYCANLYITISVQWLIAMFCCNVIPALILNDWNQINIYVLLFLLLFACHSF